MNKIIFLVSIVVSFVFTITSLHAEDMYSDAYFEAKGYVFADKASKIGLDTVTVCVVQSDTITIEWTDGFPRKGYFTKSDGKIVKIKYLSPSIKHKAKGKGVRNVSAMAAPIMHGNSIDIMLMSGTGSLQMVDIKTGDVVFEEFIPTCKPEFSSDRIPPGKRKKFEEEEPYGLPSGREKLHTVNYDNLPAGAYFMVIFNQDKEVYFIKTIYKDINEKK